MIFKVFPHDSPNSSSLEVFYKYYIYTYVLQLYCLRVVLVSQMHLSIQGHAELFDCQGPPDLHATYTGSNIKRNIKRCIYTRLTVQEMLKGHKCTQGARNNIRISQDLQKEDKIL